MFTLKLEADQSEDIKVLINKALDTAKLLTVDVEFEYNTINVLVSPASDSDRVFEEYSYKQYVKYYR